MGKRYAFVGLHLVGAVLDNLKLHDDHPLVESAVLRLLAFLVREMCHLQQWFASSLMQITSLRNVVL